LKRRETVIVAVVSANCVAVNPPFKFGLGATVPVVVNAKNSLSVSDNCACNQALASGQALGSSNVP